ncbi:hypothetical protein E4H12_06470 [Candidatus Thorarchaeota archaeon]|nr:MAG: hypothetical protein E4H12_06470 [Candidatus Thorarchaeota archaeon]
MSTLQLAISSLWSAFKDICTWNFATKQKTQERLSICEVCPARDNKRCTACGCYLPWKTKLKNAECPMDQW